MPFITPLFGWPLLVVLALVRGEIVPTDASKNISWPYHVYKTADFTPPYLEISKESSSPGYLFFAPNGPTAHQVAPIIVDSQGELVWNGPNYLKAFSFGVQEYKGGKVLTSWNGSSVPEPLGRGNGYVTLWNQHYELVANVTLPGNFLENNASVRYSSNIDLHEIYITKNDKMLVLGNNITEADLTSVGGPKNGWVVEAQVYEIDIATNKILFSWKSLDHQDSLPLTDSVYPLGTDGQDGKSQATAWGYFHINSVAPVSDDSVILSSRYLSSAITISKKTGKVLWRVQGIPNKNASFKLGPHADFRYQHHIRTISSNESCVVIKMHDNHNCPIDNGTVPASGKILEINLVTKEVNLLARYYNSSGPIYPTAQGSFQTMENGNFFTGNGWIPVLEEFSPSGEILSTIQFGNATRLPSGGFKSAGRGTLSYRGFKQTWTGCPIHTKPAVKAEYIGSSKSPRGTRVYVSWNGATEVQKWKIYGGIETPSYIKSVKKEGFETVFEVEDVQFVQVEAVLRKGAPEGCGHGIRSEVVFTQVGSSAKEGLDGMHLEP